MTIFWAMLFIRSFADKDLNKVRNEKNKIMEGNFFCCRFLMEQYLGNHISLSENTHK